MTVGDWLVQEAGPAHFFNIWTTASMEMLLCTRILRFSHTGQNLAPGSLLLGKSQFVKVESPVVHAVDVKMVKREANAPRTGTNFAEGGAIFMIGALAAAFAAGRCANTPPRQEPAFIDQCNKVVLQ